MTKPYRIFGLILCAVFALFTATFCAFAGILIDWSLPGSHWYTLIPAVSLAGCVASWCWGNH